MKTFWQLIKRTWVPLAAALVLLSAAFFPISDGWRIALVAIAAPVLLIGVYDWFQIRFTITRNYPVLARIRWLFYDLRPCCRH